MFSHEVNYEREVAIKLVEDHAQELYMSGSVEAWFNGADEIVRKVRHGACVNTPRLTCDS